MEKKELFTVLGFIILYTGFIFGGFNTLLNAKIDPLKETFNAKMESLQTRVESEIKFIKVAQKEMKVAQKEMKEDIKEIKNFLLSGKTASTK